MNMKTNRSNSPNSKEQPRIKIIESAYAEKGKLTKPKSNESARVKNKSQKMGTPKFSPAEAKTLDEIHIREKKLLETVQTKESKQSNATDVWF